MTPQSPPEADNDHLASGPRRNVQFGQEIGVDDTSPPEVAHGSRAAEARLVDDAIQGEHARYVHPLDHRPPPQEASHASEYGEPEPGPPVADLGLLDDEPSVWDASPSAEDGKPKP